MPRLNDARTRPVRRVCFQGGPKDGELLYWPDTPPTFEVLRFLPPVAKLTAEGNPRPVDPYQRGTYELVPTDEDHLWRIARLYRWKGWYGESQ